MNDFQHDRASTSAEASWRQLFQPWLKDADADLTAVLQDILEQHPELCMRLEEALGASQAEIEGGDGTNEACDATIDLRAGRSPESGSPESGSPESGSPSGGARSSPSASLDLPAIADFGDFDLLEEIGRGGMGIVYRARQKSLGRTVALKMILTGQLANAQEVRRFYAEAAAAAVLDHPHIVPIYDVDGRDGRHYYTMGYVEGPTLDEVLKAHPLRAEMAAEIVRKLALAVEYAHERGVVHRDLKPANILMDSQGEPRIADFGLAMRDGQGTDERTGDIVGTPSYMAPEQAAGRVKEVNEAADIYSLGSILYACLTGRPPFQAETRFDTLLAVLEAEATLPRQLNRETPRELEWIIMRCLEKKPDNRYPTAKALADDLERWLMGEPVEAHRTGLWPQLRRWWRRQPTLVSHLVVLVVMAIILQIMHVVLRGSTGYLINMNLIFLVWAGAITGYQWMLDRPRLALDADAPVGMSSFPQWLLAPRQLAESARFLWAATDVCLLTLALFLTGPPLGSLLIGYPLLIVAAGMFFRVRLVFFTLASCLIGFGVLAYAFETLRSPLYLAVYYAAGITSLGVMVAYQVYRIRALSRYYHKELG
jgi:serine/threonine-protein kinase